MNRVNLRKIQMENGDLKFMKRFTELSIFTATHQISWSVGTGKPRELQPPKTQPKISDVLSSLVVKTTLPIDNKYAYSPVDTSILKITISHSQNLSTVLKITNKNNKITKNNNNNCCESNNNNIILQPTRTDFITYLQLEPEL